MEVAGIFLDSFSDPLNIFLGLGVARLSPLSSVFQRLTPVGDKIQEAVPYLRCIAAH